MKQKTVKWCMIQDESSCTRCGLIPVLVSLFMGGKFSTTKALGVIHDYGGFAFTWAFWAWGVDTLEHGGGNMYYLRSRTT